LQVGIKRKRDGRRESSGQKQGGKSAFDRACRWLARAPKTEREIQLRLQQLEYARKTIEEAISRLKELGWLNDRQFAGDWLRWRAQTRPVGPRWAFGYLKRRGVPPELIAEVLDDFYTSQKEAELAVQVARNWLSSHPRGTREQLLRFLAYRGFSQAVCIESVEALFPQAGGRAE